ncbi:DNA-binding protein [Staphylococcus capitis]|nr:DNA-binding protein [Staphylococcus capitis]
MSQGKQRSVARPVLPQPFRGPNGKRTVARLCYVGGSQFYFHGLRPLP